MIKVALFTRAWIEIAVGIILENVLGVALFTRAWIEIAFKKAFFHIVLGRPFHEGVD